MSTALRLKNILNILTVCLRVFFGARLVSTTLPTFSRRSLCKMQVKSLSEMRDKVVVIGSGISGLTAAVLLNRKGYDVVVLEKQSQAGGALHRFKRQGVSFDVGFHYTGGLGHGEILQALWNYCTISKHLDILPFPDNAADHVRVDGLSKPARAFFSYDRFSEELFRLFPSEKEGIKRFFKTIREHGHSIPFYNMTEPVSPFLRKLAFPEQYSLADLLTSCTTDSRLHAILSLPVFLHGVQPDNIGLTMHASVAHPVYTGMYTVDGGGQAIADAYLHVLGESGVQVHTATPVEQILTESNHVTGVRTIKGVFPATAVIYTGHPSRLPAMVEETVLRKAYRTRLLELHNTCSMFMVFGAVSKNSLNDKLRWNNYYALPASFDIPQVHPKNPEDCFFLSGAGLRDTKYLKKSNKNRAVTLIRPASWQESSRFDRGRKKRTGDYLDWKQEEADKIVRSVNRYWDGLLDDFRVINTASPLTFRDELDYVHGAAYGVKHSMDQFAVGARTRLPGLWLSGQSTLMPGILGASLSALITVGGFVGLESIWQEITECA